MPFDLIEEHAMLRDLVAKFVDNELMPLEKAVMAREAAGGAAGNILDRLTRGAVVDFLDFHIGGWHWYVFNVADCAITVGIVMLLFDAVFVRRRKAG